MNVYEKLQIARVRLQSKNLKKSGYNKFSDFYYYELVDFLPTVNEIFLELKLFSWVSFTADIATLTVLNIEQPEEVILFNSPMAEAKLKACHEIQNMGAVETYQRRYLYTAALEIVEKDAIDKSNGSAQTESPKPVKKPNRDYRQEYIDQANGLGFEFEDLQLLAEKTGKKKFNDLPDSTFKLLLNRFAEGEEAVAAAKEFVNKVKEEDKKDGVA